MSKEEDLLEPRPNDGSPLRMDVYAPAGYVLPVFFRPFYGRVLDLPVRDDDVWIVSHPKCGSTWLTEMVWLLRNNLSFDTARKQLHKERIPFLEFTSVLLNNLNEDEADAQMRRLPMVDGDSYGFVDQWPKTSGPRTIKTHLQWNVLPKALRRPDSKVKIIYVAREAKDVCVSFYHHHRLVAGFTGCTFEEYADYFINGKLVYAPFWKHVLEFWEQRNRENILFLKYEDMKKDLSSVIHEVNEFLNLAPLSDEQMRNLNEHLSFKSMKTNRAVNFATKIMRSSEEGAHKDEKCKGDFIRKGIVGDWKSTMSPELVSRFNKWSEEHTAGSGLTF